MRTVIDKGPKDPGPEPTPPQGATSSPEHDAWKAAVKEREDWHKVDEGKPREVRMHDHDAAHAAAADPERYELVGHTAAELRAVLRSRMSLETRVAALETAYDDLVADDEDKEPDPQPAPQPDPALAARIEADRQRLADDERAAQTVRERAAVAPHPSGPFQPPQPQANK